MLLKTVIKFQKALALADAASNRHEAEAATQGLRLSGERNEVMLIVTDGQGVQEAVRRGVRAPLGRC